MLQCCDCDGEGPVPKTVAAAGMARFDHLCLKNDMRGTDMWVYHFADKGRNARLVFEKLCRKVRSTLVA